MSQEKSTMEGRNPDGTFKEGNQFSEKYKESYAKKLIEFYSQPLVREETRPTKNGGMVTVTVTNQFPTLGLFARSIGVSVTAIRAWAGVSYGGKYRHDRFAIAYTRVLEWAEGMIESGAMTGMYDANMAKFVLSNDYGKREAPIVENNVTARIDEADLEMIRRVEERLKKQGVTDGDGKNG